MQYFTEQAPTHREALERVRAKYGEQATVLSHRSVRTGGILGLFAREEIEVSGYIRPTPKADAPLVQAPQLQTKADLEEEKRKILERAKASGAAPSQATSTDDALGRVLAEIKDLKGRIDLRPGPETQDHESIRRIDELLAHNDFTEAYRASIASRMRREFTLEDLEDWPRLETAVLEWIGDSIEVAGSQAPAQGARLGRGPRGQGPRVLVLVGPTGVGKTTTIAKLAAIHTVGIGGEKPQAVRMITIDNYRIGARQQIETYGSIMGVPVSSVETAEDLKKTIDFYGESDLVLVDTIGKSPRDAVRLAEMQRIIAACGQGAEIHLALAATTKTSDMAEILRQFEPFGFGAVVLTKLDETIRLGNAISVLADRRKPLSYLTTGQKVPQDIERASVPRILTYLEGFRVDRARMEERYGLPQTAEREERR